MSKTKFTPGPWRTSGVGPTRKVFHATDTSTYHVCEIHNDIGRNDLDANAALIAAAPELFAEVETLIGVLEVGTETQADQDAIIQYAKSVLAKARGES
jgi:hypothetical protein